MKTWKNPSSKVAQNEYLDFSPYCPELPIWTKIKNPYRKLVWGTLCFIYFVVNRDNIVNYSIHFTFYKLDWIHNQPGFWLDSWKSHMRVIRIYKWFRRKELASRMNQRLTSNTAQYPSQSSYRISIFFVNSFSWVTQVGESYRLLI